MEPRAWYETLFGQDYFAIYKDRLTPELAARDAQQLTRLLALPPGSRVLDLACGHGRHAIPLAERGFRVTGFDLSDVFLERARADAKARDVDVRWIRGDMRELDFDAEFDCAINLFTAFGYFQDPEDDLKVMRAVRRALVPGGRFLLETLHRDGLVPRFLRRNEETTSEGTHVLHERDWDLARNILEDQLTVTLPDGTRKLYTTSLRMRSLHEFLALFRAAGLEPTAWYADLAGSPLELESHRLTLIAERPG